MRSILVPLDGTVFGEHALPMALMLARRSGAALHLVHVHTQLEATYAELTLFDGRRLDEEVRRTEKEYLAQVQQRVQAKAGANVTSENVDGDTVPALRRAAEEMAPDLVVMSTHGRGPLGRFWLGSVADDVVRELTMPLLLVHPQSGMPDLNAEPSLAHTLVPLDGTPHGERIIEPAAQLAKLTGADLTLLRVVSPVYPVMLPTEPAPLGGMAVELIDRIEHMQAHMQKEAAAYLEQVAAGLRQRGLGVSAHVTVEDQPGAAIVEEAHKPIDLIALETHGRHGLSRLLMGSVADKVIRGATIPVLVHCSH